MALIWLNAIENYQKHFNKNNIHVEAFEDRIKLPKSFDIHGDAIHGVILYAPNNINKPFEDIIICTTGTTLIIDHNSVKNVLTQNESIYIINLLQLLKFPLYNHKLNIKIKNNQVRDLSVRVICGWYTNPGREMLLNHHYKREYKTVVIKSPYDMRNIKYKDICVETRSPTVEINKQIQTNLIESIDNTNIILIKESSSRFHLNIPNVLIEELYIPVNEAQSVHELLPNITNINIIIGGTHYNIDNFALNIIHNIFHQINLCKIGDQIVMPLKLKHIFTEFPKPFYHEIEIEINCKFPINFIYTKLSYFDDICSEHLFNIFRMENLCFNKMIRTRLNWNLPTCYIIFHIPDIDETEIENISLTYYGGIQCFSLSGIDLNVTVPTFYFGKKLPKYYYLYSFCDNHQLFINASRIDDLTVSIKTTSNKTVNCKIIQIAKNKLLHTEGILCPRFSN